MQGVLGTFDSLNPLIVKGIALQSIRGYVVESLMARGFDEPFTLYGLIASSVETDPERSYVTFHLNPAARFSDGAPLPPRTSSSRGSSCAIEGGQIIEPITPRSSKAEVIGERAVRFDLSGSDDRELPLILGLMPVLAKHGIHQIISRKHHSRRPSAAAPTWSAKSTRARA